jgi:hypothetical protein
VPAANSPDRINFSISSCAAEASERFCKRASVLSGEEEGKAMRHG